MNKEWPFIGGAYTARSKNLNAQVCQNLYVEVDKTGAKNIIGLTGVPGHKLWIDIGYTGEVRGFTIYKGNLYAVIKDRLYKIETDSTTTNVGTINTTSGWVDLTSDDDTYIGIYEDGKGWYSDGSSVTEITDADLPVPSGATFQDGYQIISKADTDEAYLSDSDDITSWNPLQYFTAEGDGDNLVAPRSVERQLWLIGERTTEIWYNSGADIPFDRNPGGFMRIGCGAKRSIAIWEDDMVLLDNNGRIVRKMGLRLEPVSTYQIEYLISTFSKTSDAVGFIYQQQGHVFYELSFPTANKTICYDLTTGFWHTRASGTNDDRHLANCAIRFDDKIIVGDAENGKLYEYDFETYEDNSTVKRAIRVCQHINQNKTNLFHSSLELDMETGVGDTTTTDPQIMLKWSDDDSKTWSNEKWRTMGAVGKYKLRVRWNRLGCARNRIYKVTISDPVKRNITKAYLDAVPGNG
ncbi:MAG: hypothetical protein GY861_02800 [bacterium]|nr:hypothetical protein [bacterium]